ncbi:MAG: Trk system potassium transporter TrkA [SAR324 cluster bacterium]|nr:Trk system potassium transporter TrkA [SAR324 cluster bacterium]
MKVENVLILGIGGIGYHLAKRLTHEGYLVTIIEASESLVRYANESLDAKVILGNVMNFSSWKQAQPEKIDLMIACTDDDAVNTIAGLIANRLGVRLKIVRTRSLDIGADGNLLDINDLNIDLMVHPEELVAQEMVQLIQRAAANDVIDIGDGQMKVMGIRVQDDSPLLHKQLIEISQIYNEFLFRIVAIGRGITTFIPGGNVEILPFDQIFILASSEEMPKLMKLVGIQEHTVQNVMILGGGMIGRRVAELLEKTVQIKLIESDTKRAEELASDLKSTNVLYGDGTDANVLALAGVLDIDTFIATTGDNETNIISCLLAKHLINRQNRDPLGSRGKTIALVNKEDYLVLASTIGLDIALNAKISAANAILKFIRRNELLAVAHLHGVDAEVIEIVAGHDSAITRKPLHKLRSLLDNDGIIIGAVLRDNEWHIAAGDTQVRNGERVIVVCTSLNLKQIGKIFQ